MDHSDEKYFVGSSGDMPGKLHFDWAIAEAAQWEYIDSFDENGEKVRSYQLVDGKYTTDF